MPSVIFLFQEIPLLHFTYSQSLIQLNAPIVNRYQSLGQKNYYNLASEFIITRCNMF